MCGVVVVVVVGRGVTSFIWHSNDVPAEWHPFLSTARYMISLYFQQIFI